MSRTRAQAKRHAALIMASCVALLVAGYLVGEARGVLARGSVEETVAVVRGEQIAQALAQARIGNVCMDPARTRLRRLFEQRIESLAQGILGGGIGRRCHCCG